MLFTINKFTYWIWSEIFPVQVDLDFSGILESILLTGHCFTGVGCELCRSNRKPLDYGSNWASSSWGCKPSHIFAHPCYLCCSGYQSSCQAQWHYHHLQGVWPEKGLTHAGKLCIYYTASQPLCSYTNTKSYCFAKILITAMISECVLPCENRQ